MPLSKAGLRVLNNTNFPNNTTQYISPELLREFNGEMITALQLTQSMSEYAVISGGNSFIGNQNITGDLTVTGTLTVPVIHTIYETASVIYSSGSNQLGDELTDTQTLSGSVKVQGSLTINGVPVLAGQSTGSSLITASVLNNVITFTKGDLSQFNITVNTGSSNFTDLTSLNAYTASNNIKWNTLGALTGSYATTGSNSFKGNQFIDKTNALYSNALYWTSSEVGYNNLEIINQGGGNLDFASLNGGKMRIVNTPLILTGSALSSSNDISTSANIYGANLTASAIPAGTISSSAQITSLGFVSSSVTASSLITASFDNGTRNLTFTKGNNTTFAVNIPDVSGSTGNFVTTSSFNAYTQSNDQRVSSLETNSASVNISISNINTTTASLLIETQNLELFSASALISLSNLNTATASLFTSTSLSLTTASLSGQTLTFTKGNGTTFGIVLPDVSGSDISSLNAFTASQLTINTGYNTFTQSAQQSINSLNAATSSYAISSSVAAVDAAQQSQINSLISATGSYVTSAITASSLVTASVNLNTITFTKGDASTFNITVNTGSGGGSTDITSLNAFTQSILGTNPWTASIDQKFATIGGQSGSWGGGGGAISVQDEGTILGNATSFNFNGAGVTATLSAGTASITIPGGGGSIDTGSFLTTGSFNTSQNVRGAINFYPTGSTAGQAIRIYNTGSNVSGSMILGITDPGSPFIQLQQRTWFQIQGSDDLNYVAFTASFDNGLGIGPNFGSRTQMLTSSGSLGLFNPTIQRAGVMNHLSASQAARNGVNLVFADNTRTGTTIISGSDNIFTNPTTPTTGYIRYVGGNNNLYLNNSNGIGTQITASAISVSGVRPTMHNNIFNGTSNFAINQAVNGGTHTYSSNYDNGTTTINAMAFTGSLTLSNNINNNGTFTIIPASASVAEIASGFSGSHTINVQGNGLFGGSITLTTNRIQPPSVTYTIANNIAAGANISITNVSSSVGVNAQNNIANGAITYTNAGAAGLGIHRTAANINTNFGTLNLIASASAISATSNICSSALTVTNRMYTGSYGSGSVNFNNNSVQGAGHTYTVSGSYNGTGAGSAFVSNAIIGQSNTFFTNVEGRGNYTNFNSNLVVGFSLILTGSNNVVLSEQGGAYFGRFNANDGLRNGTGENILVVGTGITGARKTGFLIDSGSNIYAEGTFNVSGSTSISGSTSMTGSLTLFSSSVAPSDLIMYGHKMFNVGAFQDTTTQSGSADTAYALKLNTTDISQGVSISGSTGLQVINSGTYNIQWSGQLVQGASSSDVTVWLRKNGTDYNGTSGRVSMASNTNSLPAWNYVLDLVANDTIEIMWGSTSANTTWAYIPAATIYPAAASIIATVTQVR